MKERIIYVILTLLVMSSCSTTKNLPEGELLYIGQKPMVVENYIETPVGEMAMEEVKAALATPPNNSLLGSSTMRIPFPMGLWVYNAFNRYDKGIGRWICNRFGEKPVLLSAVNPNIRQKAATNLLRDYGYFNGKVNYQTFIDPKDSLKVKLQYTVDMSNPYIIDSVEYRGFDARTKRIFEMSRRNSLITAGKQFNVLDLNEERNRLTELMRNVGCYYFRSDYLTYQADTLLLPGGHVFLRLVPYNMPAVAQKAFYTGKKTFYLLGRNGEQPNDSVQYKDLTIHYYKKLKVRPNMLYRWMDYQSYRFKKQVQDSSGISRERRLRNLYSHYRQNRIQERLSNVGIFQYIDMQYVPRDTTYVSDTLDLNIYAALNKPYDAELDFNVKLKSNNQLGPGASFTLTKSNVFGGGETWNVKADAAYEWQTGRRSSSLMNSYDFGLSSSLTFPRVVFPHMGDKEYDFPATTTFKVYAEQLNRAKYYRLLAFGGNVNYDFQPKPKVKHSLTPFRLTFNVLGRRTAAFDSLQTNNPALYVSLRNQLIPAMSYTFTYDNSSVSNVRDLMWWQTSVTSAGNITSALFAIFGKPFNQQGKQLLDVPFAQFMKVNSEFRYHYRINRNHSIASRVAAGIIASYGNTTTAPYTEQFYIGGANSVRAFTARSIGPGGYHSKEQESYTYINHVGDIRFEANVEYRFRLIADLHGALFLDAGNVWLLRNDASRPEGQFSWRKFPEQIALGTGAGLRYDMDFLVFRLDLGVALHAPYKTGKANYYNIQRFKDGLALHFAIGYPF